MTGWPTCRSLMSAWLTRARTRIAFGIDDVDDRHAGADLFALLDLRHVVGLPDRPEDRHPADRRDAPPCARRCVSAWRIAFSARSRRILQDLEVGLGGLALEGVGGLQLFSVASACSSGEVVLLGLDSRQQLVLDHLELGARERALGQQDLAVVARPGGALARVLLLDLLLEVVQLGAAIERVRELLLAVELDEQVTLLDRRAGLDELGDDERLRVRTREPWAPRSSSTRPPRPCRSVGPTGRSPGA